MMIKFYQTRNGDRVKEIFSQKPFAELLNVAVSCFLQLNVIFFLSILTISRILNITCHCLVSLFEL